MTYQFYPEEGFSDYYCYGHITNVTNQPHVHSHIEFVFLLKGNLSLSLGELQTNLSAGQFVVILPYEVHQYHSLDSTECFILACPPEYIPDLRQMLRDRVFSPPIAPFGDDILALLEEQFRRTDQKMRTTPGQYSDLKKKALLYCAFSELLGHCTLQERPAPELDLYRATIFHLSRHFTQPLELSDVAQKLGVSPSHLSRLLNKKCGLGFSDLLNSLRVYEARRLLLQTDLSISQVAFESGFGSIRNFNRIFQKHFHTLPKDFREGQDLPLP